MQHQEIPQNPPSPPDLFRIVEPVEDRIEIHTSDRQTFRRCRRKWSFTSPMKHYLGLDGGSSNIHLWFGSGFHFAMEDWHGYRRYGSLELAFLAYYNATRRTHPQEAQESIHLAFRMFDHYRLWAKRRENFSTVWTTDDHTGGSQPLVEINWHVPLPLGDGVYYSGTFDRIVIDPDGRCWVLDYKTAQRFNTSKLETDAQCSAYLWAFKKLFGFDAEGVIYMQFLKSAPDEPVELSDGTFSVNKNQPTTFDYYKRALIRKYGNDRSKIPAKNMNFASYLKEQEQLEGNRFIRMDLVRRNEEHLRSEEWKILSEGAEMLNPNLPLYPNPTRDCSWDCDFQALCVACDDGSDVEYFINQAYRRREEMHPWRSNLLDPQELLDQLAHKDPDLAVQLQRHLPDSHSKLPILSVSSAGSTAPSTENTE